MICIIIEIYFNDIVIKMEELPANFTKILQAKSQSTTLITYILQANSMS